MTTFEKIYIISRFSSQRKWVLRNMIVLRNILLILAVAGFVIGLFLSLKTQPNILHDLNYKPIFISIFWLIPLILVFNGLEFYVASRMMGADLKFKAALVTIVIGSATNMLPLPGSALAKIAQLRILGLSYKSCTYLTLFLASIWLCLSFVYTGSWLWFMGANTAGITFLVGGTLALTGLIYKAYSLLGDMQALTLIVFIRFLLVILSALLVYMCFWALQLESSFAQASVLSLSGVLGSALSIVPSGIGISEGIGVVIGTSISILPAVAFLVVTLIRVLNFITIIPISLLLLLVQRNGNK